MEGQTDGMTDAVYRTFPGTGGILREFHRITQATIIYELLPKKSLVQNDFSTFFSSEKRKPCSCLVFKIYFLKNKFFPLWQLFSGCTKIEVFH